MGTTTTVTFIPAPDLNLPKQGSKCCGCCCDMRRAVIIVNIVQIVFSILGGMIAIAGAEFLSQIDEDSSTDMSAYEDMTRISGYISLGGIVFYVLGIVGAATYNMILVGIAGVWYIIGFCIAVSLNIVAVNEFNEDNPTQQASYGIFDFVVSAIIVALFVYPHAGFIHEMKNGTMSAKTYPREKFSCCCT